MCLGEVLVKGLVPPRLFLRMFENRGLGVTKTFAKSFIEIKSCAGLGGEVSFLEKVLCASYARIF